MMKTSTPVKLIIVKSSMDMEFISARRLEKFMKGNGKTISVTEMVELST